MDANSLFLSVVAGAVGTAYFVYGKKRAKYVAMISGVALCVVPFFFDSILVQSVLCIILAAAPWIYRE